jgi:uncharacterized damage-inducible protein DinB
MGKLERPASDEYSSYFQRYLDRVPGDDAAPLLASQLEETLRQLGAISEPQAMHRYAEGKWSVKEVLLHLCDAERVFLYRALSFARGAKDPLSGFDENAWVPESAADRRPMPDLVDEFRAVRTGTLAFARGCPPEALVRRGVANGTPMSVRAALWIIVGHERHHLGILRERYGVGA